MISIQRLIRFQVRGVRMYCSNATASPKVIFSGIQPTGTVHLGNYLGAISNWIELQNNSSHKLIVSIVDWHALTVKQGTAEGLRGRTLRLAATLLACGIDPSKTLFFKQSAVPQHTELAWFFNCLSTVARMQGMAQFKDKSSQFARNQGVPVSLLTYPLLQAADILLYRADLVPVGEDQVQHIQIAQHLAQTFNSKYASSFFPTPQQILTNAPRIRSLRNPEQKMSKSDRSEKSRIVIQDTADNIEWKLMKAATDFTSEVTYDPAKRPGVSNLIAIHAALKNISPEEVCAQAQGLKTGDYKKKLIHVVQEHLDPIRERYSELMKTPHEIDAILNHGAESARVIAEENMNEIKNIIGLK